MNNKVIDEVKKIQQEESEHLLRKKEIDRYKTLNEHERLIKAQEEIAAYSNIDLTKKNEDVVQQMIRENAEYMAAAKKCMPFICKEFNRILPNFGRNINLIGAVTGEGKSTAVANIALSTMMRGGRTLVICNEEARADVLNRITCLIQGWSYTNHSEFTEEQKKILEVGIAALSNYIEVVDDSRSGPGTTTTLEGIVGTLESVRNTGAKFDAIVIDYVQKISHSKKNPYMKSWEVIQEAMLFLDNFKHTYLAPITIFAQLWPAGPKNEKTFEERIKGCKNILVPVTCALEMKADKKTLTTKWTVHKNRWYNEDLNSQEFSTGWYKGKYVSLDHPGWNAWAKQKQGERIARTLKTEAIDAAINGNPGTSSSNGSGSNTSSGPNPAQLSGTPGDQGAK